LLFRDGLSVGGEEARLAQQMAIASGGKFTAKDCATFFKLKSRVEGVTVAGKAPVMSDLDERRAAGNELESAVRNWAAVRAARGSSEWREAKCRMSARLKAKRGGLDPDDSDPDVLRSQAERIRSQTNKHRRQRNLYA